MICTLDATEVVGVGLAVPAGRCATTDCGRADVVASGRVEGLAAPRAITGVVDNGLGVCVAVGSCDTLRAPSEVAASVQPTVLSPTMKNSTASDAPSWALLSPHHRGRTGIN